MAAVTFDSGPRNSVFGDLVALVGQADIANDADTWDTKLGTVLYVAATSNTNAAIGATVSGGVVTFQTGGAEVNVKVLVIGTY